MEWKGRIGVWTASPDRLRRADYLLPADQIKRIQQLSRASRVGSSEVVRRLLDYALERAGKGDLP